MKNQITSAEAKARWQELSQDAAKAQTEYLRIRNEERRKEQEAYAAKVNAETEASKAKLAAEYQLPRDAKFERAWSIAWEHGHSSGLSEVESYFIELVDLIK